MILYMWAIGIIFTISVFAVKVGLGLGIYPSDTRRKILLLSLYPAIFLGMGMLVEKINLLDYFSFFQKFLQYGMVVHTSLALGMILWGIYLLNSKDYDLCGSEGQKTNSGKSVWLVLLPCPVCLTAILLSISVGVAISGHNGLLVGMFLGLIFDLVAGITVLGCQWRLRYSRTEPELRLGLLMLGIGAYFFLALGFIRKKREINK